MKTLLENNTNTKTIKIGFVGTGWIGRNRMTGVLNEPFLQPVAIVDTDDNQALAAKSVSKECKRFNSLWEMLNAGTDAVVIATPSAMHAEQAMQALNSGCAVFCQKPLGRDAKECTLVINTAKEKNLLLGVDMSYRFLDGVQIAKKVIQNHEIGNIFAVDCCFHNAYGPDKAWFYDPESSGGGCLIDLGIHLIDLSMWIMGFPKVNDVSGALYSKGTRIKRSLKSNVEDFADVRIELETGTVIKTACSWKISAGCNAIINWTFYGSNGTICVKNVNGSFYDFITEKYSGTSRSVLHNSPQNWGEVAIREWAKKLFVCNKFDESVEKLIAISSVIDQVYSGNGKTK
jgi:predicted dehydrogenase